jgi:hypothetical protein
MLSAGDQVVANGAGDVIKLGGGYSPLLSVWNGNVITANGAGDTISVGNASSSFLGLNVAGVILATNAMIHASGANDTITFLTANDNGDPVAFYTYSQVDGGGTGATTNGIGANSTVSYADNATLAFLGFTPSENVWVRGDLAGTAAADGSVNMITLKNVVHASGDQVTFANLNASGAVLGETWLGQVNVSSVSTLADALNLAAATAAMSSQAGGANTPAGVMAASTGLIDWFQFGGNTYIVEAINGLNTTATHTGLAAGDEVIKIVGLVNLSGDFLAGNTVTL